MIQRALRTKRLVKAAWIVDVRGVAYLPDDSRAVTTEPPDAGWAIVRDPTSTSGLGKVRLGEPPEGETARFWIEDCDP